MNKLWEVSTTEFAGGDKGAPVRHQRVEFRLPESVDRAHLETFRDNVAKSLNQKTFRLVLGEERPLFEFVAPGGGTLRARIKAIAGSPRPE